MLAENQYRKSQGLFHHLRFRIFSSASLSTPPPMSLWMLLACRFVQTHRPSRASTILEPQVQHDFIQQRFALIGIRQLAVISIAAEKRLLHQIFGVTAIVG